MKKSVLMIASVLLCLSACTSRESNSNLVILHVNDTHSHLDPLRDGNCGVIERAAVIDSVRAARGAENVLLLHAGDFSQGSSYFTMLNGDLEIDLINALGYDCVTLGNHEFDNGIEELGRRLGNINCPVVCANYDLTPFEAGKFITPYTIVTKASQKIGIIGLLTDISRVVDHDTADRIPYLGPDDAVANKWASYLKNEEQCDLVILLTHLGYREDLELVPLIHGVDIIVGGHSHTFLDEKTVLKDADGKDVIVVQDGCWGFEVAQLSYR